MMSSPNAGLVAGLSVTAVVAATSVMDRSMRRPKNAPVAQAKPRTSAAVLPQKSASQDSVYVFGNMMLITNM